METTCSLGSCERPVHSRRACCQCITKLRRLWSGPDPFISERRIIELGIIGPGLTLKVSREAYWTPRLTDKCKAWLKGLGIPLLHSHVRPSPKQVAPVIKFEPKAEPKASLESSKVAAEIVAAYLKTDPDIQPEDIPQLITEIRHALDS